MGKNAAAELCNRRKARPTSSRPKMKNPLTLIHSVLLVAQCSVHTRSTQQSPGIDAYPSPTPTSRYLGLASRGRFVAREVYFYARYLISRTLAGDAA